MKAKKIPDLKTYNFDASSYIKAFCFSARDKDTGRLISKKLSKQRVKKTAIKKTI